MAACVGDMPKTFADCVRWARDVFEEYFVRKIKQLTHLYPEDAMTKSGLPFWSPPKRFPKAAVFDANNPTHIEFIVAAGMFLSILFSSIFFFRSNEINCVMIVIVIVNCSEFASSVVGCGRRRCGASTRPGLCSRHSQRRSIARVETKRQRENPR